MYISAVMMRNYIRRARKAARFYVDPLSFDYSKLHGFFVCFCLLHFSHSFIHWFFGVFACASVIFQLFIHWKHNFWYIWFNENANVCKKTRSIILRKSNHYKWAIFELVYHDHELVIFVRCLKRWKTKNSSYTFTHTNQQNQHGWKSKKQTLDLNLGISIVPFRT